MWRGVACRDRQCQGGVVGVAWVLRSGHVVLPWPGSLSGTLMHHARQDVSCPLSVPLPCVFSLSSQCCYYSLRPSAVTGLHQPGKTCCNVPHLYLESVLPVTLQQRFCFHLSTWFSVGHDLHNVLIISQLLWLYYITCQNATEEEDAGEENDLLK